MTAVPPPLVLASSSPHRRALLERIGLRFQCQSPTIDESARDREPAQVLVLRLAEAKARAVAADHPDAIIIGSDQAACLDDRILGKPGTRAAAIAQLTAAAGRSLVLQTGLCLLDARSGRAETLVEPFRVHFRPLTQAQIEGYLEREDALSCAGSFKSEALGIALFTRFEGDDPTALIGLPLMRLIPLLENCGIYPLGA